MEDLFRFPVFLRCPDLPPDQMKTIQTYLRVRRRSGGGDSGALTRVTEGVYRIAYKHEKDQQRVLQRAHHVVELPTGRVVFTVRDKLEDFASAPVTTATPEQDLTAPGSSTSSPTPPSSVGEYELQLDAYLLRYLNESPEAGREVEKDLTSVACSAQLHPDQGRVVVRCSAPPVAAGGDRNWKSEVDKIFDGYQCHYEPDPRKVRDLLQSCMSPQTSDGVKVYNEDMMAVVVGKRSQVNARLMNVEEAHAKRGSLLSEKQTSTCRLDEAKLRLLWKEIEYSLGEEYPGVKVTQGDAGQVVLEGSVDGIVKAGAWISDLESQVLERIVSDKSPPFLAFLRKAYGGPGVLAEYLGVSDEVEVELRDTELRLFTRSADKLDDMEKKLQQNFKEVKINLPNSSSVPSDLQEILKSKIKEMNQAQPRAQVWFGPQSTLSLMGHIKEVEELSETVTQFILDQSSIEGKVTLPFPALAEVLPELLQMHNLNYSGVTLHNLTSAAGPMIVLEGPASKVTDFRNRLGPFLDSLVQARVTIDLPGAVRYFKSPSGRENILSIAQSQKCFMLLQEKPEIAQQNLVSGSSLSRGGTVVSSYNLLYGLQVLVCQGDITKVDADALVNAANEDLDHCGGVAAALSKAAGPQVQKESRAIVKQQGKIPTGDVVVTTGGNLHCKNLLHAVGPVGGKSGGKERKLLEKTIRSTLDLAELMNFESVAMPCISSGSFGVPIAVCSEAIVTAVQEFGSQGGRSLRRIILIDNRAEVVRALKEACDCILDRMNCGNLAPTGAAAAAPGHSVHVEIIRGTIETQQVDALVSPMIGLDPLSTRVGNALAERIGSQLSATFREEVGEKMMLMEMGPGDSFLVEGLPGLPSNAVFFLDLIPWDDDQDGTAVQVLRAGINQILTSCEHRGFGSVALPVLGAGVVLRFPVGVVATVLLEEVCKFGQDRRSSTPLRVHIVIHPNDREAMEAFTSVQEAFQVKRFTRDAPGPDRVLPARRIVLLGKTGSGKSSLANNIFGENLFQTNHTPNSGTSQCQAETKTVNGRSVTLIDTPGFFDSERSEEDLKREVVRCITECAPGPHAFLILLKVEKFTEHEQDVVNKIYQCFTEDALKYAVVVFTHGNQLPRGMRIDEFVGQNEKLSDLVKKCGGRCHVMDNKYWENDMEDYRSNQFQVEELLNTIDKMVQENNGGYYMNKMFEAVEKKIQEVEEQIKKSPGNMTVDQIRQKAKAEVFNGLLILMTGTATGALLGAVFGVVALVKVVIAALQNPQVLKKFLNNPAANGLTAVAGGEAGLVVAGVGGAAALAGGIAGGVIGNKACEGAETPQEAAERAFKAVTETGNATLSQIESFKL